LYIIKKLSSKYNLKKIKIGILGMSFKAECDDIRSSLSYKLKKNLETVCKEVICTDPYVTEDQSLKTLNYMVHYF
jgi:UDP-N-acetyl-D-mannosaminuronic acid dehydrogenase